MENRPWINFLKVKALDKVNIKGKFLLIKGKIVLGFKNYFSIPLKPGLIVLRMKNHRKVQ